MRVFGPNLRWAGAHPAHPLDPLKTVGIIGIPILDGIRFRIILACPSIPLKPYLIKATYYFLNANKNYHRL